MNADFLELARSRYSERRFDSRPIGPEALERILEAGRVVPTARNLQPQKFCLIRSAEALAKLDELIPYRYGAPLVILVCYDRHEVWTRPTDEMYDNYNSGEQDASIAAATMMYEAEELGVHTLWIRGFDSRPVMEAFGLPEHLIPVMMLALGYPGENSRPSRLHADRKPIGEFVIEL